MKLHTHIKFLPEKLQKKPLQHTFPPSTNSDLKNFEIRKPFQMRYQKD